MMFTKEEIDIVWHALHSYAVPHGTALYDAAGALFEKVREERARILAEEKRRVLRDQGTRTGKAS